VCSKQPNLIERIEHTGTGTGECFILHHSDGSRQLRVNVIQGKFVSLKRLGEIIRGMEKLAKANPHLHDDREMENLKWSTQIRYGNTINVE
jgi:hypothetical protein